MTRVYAARATLRAVLVVVGTAVALVAAAGPAAAHNVLVSTNPLDRSTVSRAPDAVVLTFNQPAIGMGTELVVTGPDGDVQQGAPRLIDTTVRQDLQPGAPAGAYTVRWRVTSADGHPISGTFAFTATAAAPQRSGVPTAKGNRPTASPSPPPAPTRRTAFAWWALIPLGVVVLVTAVVVPATLVRRSRRPPAAPPEGPTR